MMRSLKNRSEGLPPPLRGRGGVGGALPTRTEDTPPPRLPPHGGKELSFGLLSEVSVAGGILLALFLCVPLLLSAANADRFVFAQLERPGRWDPYPDVWAWGAVFLRQTTRLDPVMERRIFRVSDDALFESPFVAAAGRGELSFSETELNRLRDYLSAGGFLFLDDTEASAVSPFSRTARVLPDRLFAGARWRPVPHDHALYRSFFLLRSASGRKRVDPSLQGLWLADRLVAVWSSNDLLGALARDRRGQPLLPCEPGGESQREESARLFVNIVMFSVTGTYKTDAVHQPFIEKKLGP